MELNEHQKMAETHFDKYLAGVLRNHGEKEEVINKCRFHYITAWVHGAKHEQQGR